MLVARVNLNQILSWCTVQVGYSVKSDSEVVYRTGRLQCQILEASGACTFGQSKLLHAPAANSSLTSRY